MATIEDYKNARFAYTPEARFVRTSNVEYPWEGVTIGTNRRVIYTDRGMLEICAVIVEEAAISRSLGEKYEAQLKRNEEIEGHLRRRNEEIKNLNATIKEQRAKIEDLQEQNEIERIQDILIEAAPSRVPRGDVLQAAQLLYARGLRKMQS